MTNNNVALLLINITAWFYTWQHSTSGHYLEHWNSYIESTSLGKKQDIQLIVGEKHV